MTPLDFLEWAWLVTHLVGTFIYVYISRDAISDVRAARPEITAKLKLALNGRRGIYASMYLRIAVTFLVLHILFAIAGVAQILAPNPLEPGARVVSAVVSIALSLMMDAVGVLNLIDRARIVNYKPPK